MNTIGWYGAKEWQKQLFASLATLALILSNGAGFFVAFPQIAFAAGGDDGSQYLEITCDNVEISGDTWTVSGTWKAYNFAGQSDSYDVAIFAPDVNTVADSSSNDAPDIFATTTSPTVPSDYVGVGLKGSKDDMEGTWSNVLTFGSAPASLSATLYHAQVPGNESSGDAVCSFTLPPSLTLAKTVVNNNGGSAIDTDWTLSASSTDTLISGVEGDSSITGVSVTAGTYTLSESNGPSGYTSTGWSCTAGSLSGDQLTLVDGEDAVCTVTNDDDAPTTATLTLQKTVIKDNGGTALDTDWTLSASSTDTLISGAEGDAAITSATVTPGTFTLSEAGGPNGYTASDWICDGATVSNGNEITLAAGDSATCTITNDDISGSISGTKFKDVDGDGDPQSTDGDPGLSGWTIRLYEAGGSPWVLTESTTTDSNGDYAFTDVGYGNYKICEVMQEGWSQTFPDIADNNSSPDSSNEGSKCQTVNINTQGETNTKNFGNYLLPTQGTVTLHKQVVTDNGGDAVAGDFTLSLGNGSATTTVTLDSATAFDPGTYTVVETGPDGYEQTGMTCSTDGGEAVETSSLTVVAGHDYECTVTNDDIAPTLTLEKIVSGGDASTTDWTLTASSTNTLGFLQGLSGVSSSLFAGIYSLSESTEVPYYSAGPWICNDVELDGDLILALAQVVTCSITNTYAPTDADLSVTKDVDNQTPTEGTQIVYTITVTNTGPADATNVVVTDSIPSGLTYVSDDGGGDYNDGTGEWTVGDLVNGAYATLNITVSVDENTAGNDIVNTATATSDLNDPDSSDDTGTAPTVTPVNQDAPVLTIVKNTVSYDGTFEFSISGGEFSTSFSTTTDNGVATTTLSLGDGETTYSLTEVLGSSWDLYSVSCVLEGSDGEFGSEITDGIQFTVDNGDVVMCTFTNVTNCDEETEHYNSETGECDLNQNESYSDLELTKEVSDENPHRGDQITYTLTLTNNGPHEAGNIQVEDLLPTGVTYVSHDAFSGTFATSTGTWSLISLGNEGQSTLEITVTVDSDLDYGAVINNTASITTSDSIDEDSENDESTAAFTVYAPQCSDGIDNDGDGMTDYGVDPQCDSRDDDNEGPDNNGGGGGGIGGGITGLGGGNGLVLGASTSAGGVLGESCGLYMDQHLRLGYSGNNADQVAKLQEFLNKHGFGLVPVTGFFGLPTENAVKAFQGTYRNEILAPWGISDPTGLVYLTTLRQINLIECPHLSLQIPPLVPWSLGGVGSARSSSNVSNSSSSQPEEGGEEMTHEDTGESMNSDQSASVGDAVKGNKGGFWKNLWNSLFGR